MVHSRRFPTTTLLRLVRLAFADGRSWNSRCCDVDGAGSSTAAADYPLVESFSKEFIGCLRIQFNTAETDIPFLE